MAQNYTRQSSFNDGDTISASLFNDEFNQLVNSFSYSSSSESGTGHRHDGSAGQGGNIYRIGDLDFFNKIEADSVNNRWGVFVEVGGAAVEQVRIQDGAVVPVTNNDVDLGSVSLEFKDLYLDGTANIDSLVADTADINGGTIDGVTIGGSSAGAITGTTITGTSFVSSGDMTFGDNDKAIFGTSTELEIYYSSGANVNLIDSPNVNIQIGANAVDFTSYGGTPYATIDSSGIDVTGTVTADGLTVEGTNGNFEVATTGNSVNMTRAGNNFITASDAVGDLFLGAGGVSFLKIDNGGDISFYEDTGTTAKFFWDASAERLGVGTTSPVSALDVSQSGDLVSSGLSITRSGANRGSIYLNSSDDTLNISRGATGAIAINASGNVGIGTTSPSALGLQVTKGTGVAAGVLFSNPANNWQIETGTTTNYLAFTDNQFDERMRIDASGNVGIGTSSPATPLEVQTSTDNSAYIRVGTSSNGGHTIGDDIAALEFYGADASGSGAGVKGSIRYQYGSSSGATTHMAFAVADVSGSNDVERMRIDSSGNLLVGRSSAFSSSRAEIQSAGSGGTGASECLTLNNTGADGNMLELYDAGTTVGSIGNRSTALFIDCAASTGAGLDLTQLAVLPRKDGALNNGDVSLGESSYRFKDLYLSGVGYIDTIYSGLNLTLGADEANDSSAGNSNILFKTDGSEKARLDSSGNLLVGTTSEINLGDTTGSGVQLNGIGAFVKRTCTTSTQGLLQLNNIGTTGNVVEFYIDGIQTGCLGVASGAALTFVNGTGSSEAMRLDSSGNLLVGTTTANPTSIANNTPGVELSNTGGLRSSVDNDPAATLNRKTAEGILVLLRVDGGTKGSIGVKGSRPFLSNNINFSVKIDDFANGSFIPADEDGAASDNVSDIGSASARWDDIYATNSTIQTSDANEKQDIAELDEAERRVAAAAKGLLRKFRWIDSVEAKGDEARIHFGIIAQDLQAAFEAEGLDAGRYAMFIHSTWTDEETGEERSRMGVRYSELLAFIIAAL